MTHPTTLKKNIIAIFLTLPIISFGQTDSTRFKLVEDLTKYIYRNYLSVDIAKSMRETAEDFIKNEVLDVNSLVRVVGDVTELSPFSYQLTKNGKAIIHAKYILSGNSVKIQTGDYDKNQITRNIR